MSNLIFDQRNYIRSLESHLGHMKSTVYDLKTSYILLHEKIICSGTINASLYTSRHLNEENSKLNTENCIAKFEIKHLKAELKKV